MRARVSADQLSRLRLAPGSSMNRRSGGARERSTWASTCSKNPGKKSGRSLAILAKFSQFPKRPVICDSRSPAACGASAGDAGAVASADDASAGKLAPISGETRRDPDGRALAATVVAFSSEGTGADDGVVAPCAGEMAPLAGEVPTDRTAEAFAGKLTPFAGDRATAVGILFHWRWGPGTGCGCTACATECNAALDSCRRMREFLPRLWNPPTPCFSRRCLKSFVREEKCSTFPHWPSQHACCEMFSLCGTMLLLKAETASHTR